MRYAYFPPRNSISKQNHDGKELIWTNMFPQIFGELFMSAGWELVNDGYGRRDSRTDCILFSESWEYWKIDLGIFHWIWDYYENFEDILVYAKKKNKKILWVCHELENHETLKKDIVDKNRNLMLQHADYICSLNAGDFEKIKSSRGNVFYMPHFIPNTMIREYKEAFFYNNCNARLFSEGKIHQKTFCFYGLANENKGILELMTGWNAIRNRYPDWTLKIFSYCSPVYAYMESLIFENTNEQTEWIQEGYEFIPDQLGEFAILPYKHSNNSGVIHELTAYECPVVSTCCSAFEKYSLVMNNDIEFLISNAIENIAELRQKAKEKKRMLLEENIESKKSILDLAGRILLDMYDQKADQPR